MASNTSREAVSIALADLTQLATLVVESLQVQLASSLRQDVEQLLKEQEQRLLAAMAPKRDPVCPSGGSTARAKRRVPSRRLSRENLFSGPGRASSSKSDLTDPTRGIRENSPETQWPGEGSTWRAEHHHIVETALEGGKRPEARYLRMNFARSWPPWMQSIAAARDDELLGQAWSPRSEHRGADRDMSGGKRYFLDESANAIHLLRSPSKGSCGKDPGHGHALAEAPISSHGRGRNSEAWMDAVTPGGDFATDGSSRSQQCNRFVQALEEMEVAVEPAPALPPPLPVQPTSPRCRDVDLPGAMAESDQLRIQSRLAVKTPESLGTRTQSLSSDLSESKEHHRQRSRSTLGSRSSDARAVRLQREEELLSQEGSARRFSPATTCAVQGLSSPLPLRICGILSRGSLTAPHRWGMPLLAMLLVGTCARGLYHAQVHIRSPMNCTWGICIHFGYINDLLLAVCSTLGLLAMRRVTSENLLGNPATLLAHCCTECHAVQKWSSASRWQSLYLSILWIGGLAFRAAAMRLDPGVQEVIQACVFTLASALFLVLVFGIQHMSCCMSVLIDSYVLNLVETMDPVKAIQQWDKLTALLRNASLGGLLQHLNRVSRAVDWGFLLVQSTAGTMLLLSITSFMLQGNQQIWRLISDALLAQSLVLLLSKAAEVTEMCARMPSLVNGLDFGGDALSHERHYLVQHITQSSAGFYVGEVRLTAMMVLKFLYLIILAALGVLTKVTTT